MRKISVALATYNEEENIGKCLESVSGWVGEIVIVDGKSTDRTVEIAKTYNAKIALADNPPIFHINKQKAIDSCNGEWILQLDADEVVSEELKIEILNIINPQPTTHNPQQINGFWIPRKNFFLGKFLKKGGQYPDYTLRLYRNGKGKLPAKNVHEQAQVEGNTGYLRNPLLHYSYPNFRHYMLHFNIYTDIFANELREKNLEKNLSVTIDYLIIKPVFWFMKTFFRHKGFIDGYQGFIFSFFSSMRFPVSYLKYLKIIKKE